MGRRGTQGGLGAPPDQRRCTWERDGARCKRWDWQDRLCRDHHEATELEAEERRAVAAVSRLAPDPGQLSAEPFEAFGQLLQRGQAEARAWSQTVDELREQGRLIFRTKSGRMFVHPAAEHFLRERASLGKIGDVLVRAGVAHRLAEIRAAESEQGDSLSAAEADDLLDAVTAVFDLAIADAVGDTGVCGTVVSLENFGAPWDELKLARGEPGEILVRDPRRGVTVPMKLLDSGLAENIRAGMARTFPGRVAAEMEWRRARRQQGKVVRGRAEPPSTI